MTDAITPTDQLIIERIIDAPPALVWRLWTEPDHFAAWYGPYGATIPDAVLDVRVGGQRRVTMEMSTPAGARRMWFIGEHLEVSEARRLVYTESMADEAGRVLTAAEMGLPGDHPTVTQVTVELEDLGGRTRLVLTHAGIPADSPGAMGWAMALDKLAARAASAIG